jgi:hypothetical protein
MLFDLVLFLYLWMGLHFPPLLVGTFPDETTHLDKLLVPLFSRDGSDMLL